MSYNIDTFKLKSIALMLPKDFDLSKYGDGWDDKIVLESPSKWSLNDNGEGLEMHGHFAEDGSLVVDELSCSGEWSGHTYEDVLKPMLEEFKGSIDAAMVWEGGDTINRLKAVKGKITEADIEL